MSSAAVSACESIVVYRRDAGDLSDEDGWAASRDLALDLVLNLVREAAALR